MDIAKYREKCKLIPRNDRMTEQNHSTPFDTPACMEFHTLPNPIHPYDLGFYTHNNESSTIAQPMHSNKQALA